MIQDMIRKRIQIGETAATVYCEEGFLESVIEGILEARTEIKAYGSKHPEFIFSTVPVEPDDSASELIRRMCLSGRRAHVGPMASVAGAIAASGVKSARDTGATHCVVDNGGDIALLLDHEISIGLLDQLDSSIIPTVNISPSDGEIMGICTSSGRFGQSISFGRADMATVAADDPLLADALATALGNSCGNRDDIEDGLNALQEIDGVRWAIVKVDGAVGTFGDMPRIRYGRRKEDSLTIHSEFPADLPLKTEI